MRELNENEIIDVNGGFFLGVVGGLVGNYLYDAVGGKEGIDEFFEEQGKANDAANKYGSNQATD
ncbi:MAG: hypothetical protein ACPGSN_03030 [Psychrobium sp.]